MDGHRARVDGGRIAPDPPHELLAGEHASRVAGHEPQQVELTRGQAERLVVPDHVSARRVDDEPVEGQLLVGHDVELGAPQHGANAGSELTGRERLRNVVVGAELEPDDPVGLLAAGGQHDHGQP